MSEDSRDPDKLQRLAHRLDKERTKLTKENSALKADLETSQLEIHGLRERNSLLAAMVREIQEQRASDETRIAELTAQVDSLHQFQADHFTDHSATLEALRQELADLRSRDSDAGELKAALQTELGDCPARNAGLAQADPASSAEVIGDPCEDAATGPASGEIARLRAELANARAEASVSLERTETEKSSLAVELHRAQEQLAAAEKRIAGLTKQAEKRKRERRNLKAQVSAHEQAISLFGVEKMAFIGRIGELESAHTEFENESGANLAAIQRLTAERDAALARLQTLEPETARLGAQGAQSRAELAALQEKYDSLSMAHTRASEQLALLTAELSERETAVQQATELAAALRAAGKDSNRLRTLLQRSLDSDQRSQQFAGQLQAELAVSERLLADATGREQGLVERVLDLERANQALEKRLSEARPNVEAEEKVTKLTAMLEKAKVMWSEAAMQNKELMGRLSPSNLSLCSGDAFAIQGTDMGRLPENGSVVNAYLRTTLIQFFGCEANRRGELVALILQLVGCSEQQVRAAQRQWERSNQLIHKTTGLFGF
jgi:chromosome segregation ATPase